jgi:DNA-binding CsgD family transcriptional regulator
MTLISRASPGIAPEAARAVRDQAAGNPLALLELPGALDESGLAGGHALGDAVSVTAAVEEAFLQRSRRLSDAGRWALLLAAANDADDRATVERAVSEAALGLDEVERAGLLRVKGGRIVFRHPLVRSSVYTAATDGERRRAHRALAAGLSDAQAARRAWHLVEAGAPPDEQTARSLADAGEAARRGGACASAVRLLERAASVTPDAALRAKRLLLAAEAAWHGGEPQRAGVLVDESERLANDADLMADIAIARWRVATSGGSLRALFDPFVERANRVAADYPDKAASMLAIAWDWPWLSLDIAVARDLIDRAEEHLRGDLHSDDLKLLSAVSWQRLADCRVDEALDAARLVIELSRAAPDIQVAFACEALSAADLDDEALLALTQATDQFARFGHLPALAYGVRAKATIELRQGRLLQALKTAGEAQALADEGAAPFPGYGDVAIATVEAVAGSEEACRAHVARALERFAGEDHWGRAESLAALGLLELGVGNDGAARTALDETERLLRPVRHQGFIRFAADRIETLVRLGEESAARDALAAFEERVESAPIPWARHVAARAGMLLSLPDQLDAAYDRVCDAPVQSGFEACRSSLVYGERLRRAGRRVDAREQLRSALEGFHALGAERWERRARTELRASGARLRKATADTRDELTPQELQVALVIAEGVTNREAAARLFLSPKTIEVHLSRAYRKLGVHNRTELARRLSLESGATKPPPTQARALAALLLVETVPDSGMLGHGTRSDARLSDHRREIETAVERAGGGLIELAGERASASFGAVSSAITSALAIRRILNKARIQTRAALHVGEIERSADGEVRGAALQVVAAALGEAGTGEIVVTRAVQEATVGGAFRFRSRGEPDGIGHLSLLDAEPRTKA